MGNLKMFTPFKKSIILKEGLLCKVTNHNLAYIVPNKILIKIAISIHHQYAHIGGNKLRKLIGKYVWHPTIYRFCTDIATSCYHCQRAKISNVIYAPPTLKIQTSQPFEMVAMDLLSLPKTSKGNTYALIMVDHCSKWVAAVPLKDKKVHSVVNAFQHSVLPYLPRIPLSMLSDNGREFIGPEFESLLSSYKIQHILTTPYSSSSNGVVERINRTILQFLRLSLTNFYNWDNELSKVVIIYNHTYHVSIEMMPCEYIMTQSHVSQAGLPCKVQEEKYWEEGHANFENFEVGRLIGLKLQLPGDLVVNKFKPRYSGPMEVVVVNKNRVTYVVRSLQDMRLYKVHHRQIRNWKIPPQHLSNHPLFRSLLMDEEMEELQIQDEEYKLLSEEEERILKAPTEEAEEEDLFEGFTLTLEG